MESLVSRARGQTPLCAWTMYAHYTICCADRTGSGHARETMENLRPTDCFKQVFFFFTGLVQLAMGLAVVAILIETQLP